MRTWRAFGAPAACTLALALGGCGLPPTVSVAAWFADGVSYVASGKSVTDHAISGASNRDCALLRIVRDEAICRAPDDGDETLTASAPPTPAEPDAAGDDPVVLPAEAAYLAGSVPASVAVAPAPGAEAGLVAAAHPAALSGARTGFARQAVPVAKPVPAAFAAGPAEEDSVPAGLARVSATVAGSFADRANARALAARLADLDPRVTTATVDGRIFHRVVVEAAVATVRARGVADAWPVRL